MEKQSAHLLGTKPITPLLIGMSAPLMVSMLVQALYNIVDSIFVAMISESALTSVSLAFPVQNLMISISVGTAVGAGAVVSRKLGQKDTEGANIVACNGILLTIVTWIVFAILGVLGSSLFMNLFTTDAHTAAEGTTYLRICTVFSLGIFSQITLERLLQATGKTIYQLYSQGTGAIVNIILDPILIFGWFGLPAMGVTGAAIATVTGQTIGMLMGLFFNLTANHDIKIRLHNFKPHFKIIREIYEIGAPAIVMQSIGSVMMVGMNKILVVFSETAVSVFIIYFKLQNFVFMPIYGITNAMIPIVSYNYGARQKKRILDSVRVSTIMITAIMVAGACVFIFVPHLLLSMFYASASMMEIGTTALRILAISFPSAGICIVLSAVFQAMNESLPSLWLSIIRQLVVLLPCAYLLSLFHNVSLVWYSFLIAEVVCLPLALYFFYQIYHNKIKML